MRAREPDRAGLAEVDGVRVGYEIFGTGEITIVLVPSWTIVHSRFWKGQVPYLSRHFRVVTFDNPGNGRSDRPEDPAAYGVDRRAQAALAVMEETGTGRAVVACLSAGAQVGLWLAAHVPERVLGTVYIGAAVPFGNTPPHPDRAAAAARFDQPYTKTDGWYKYNRQYWLDQYEDFATFFFQTCFPEPHSTKQIEDCIGWALDTVPEVLVADSIPQGPSPATYREWCGKVDSPSLVIHGDQDGIRPINDARILADLVGGSIVRMEGSGHIPLARDPVRTNLLIREFAEAFRPPGSRRRSFARAAARPKRALFVSSPIGLGHVHRDLAIAGELRKLVPDLEVD